MDAWKAEWGVGDPAETRGGLTRPRPEPSPRQVVLLQRKSSSIGKGLGKTSGWVHRAALKAKGVEQVTGVVSYDRIDDEGLHVTVALGQGEDAGADGPATEQRTYAVDSVVVCAGQESVRTVADALEERGLTGARHRRGRGRRGARRQARHPPGHRGRHPHLSARRPHRATPGRRAH